MKRVGEIYTFNEIEYRVTENHIVRSVDRMKLLLLLNLGAIVGFVLLTIVSFLLFDSTTIVFPSIRYVLLFVYLILFIPFHEFLHGLAFNVFGKVKRKDIKFGLILNQGLAYCISKIPVTVKSARISLMMPVYLGVLPIYVIGIVLKDPLILLAANFCLAGSVGDFYYMWKLKNTKGNLFMHEEMPTKKGYELGYILYEKKGSN